MVYFHQRRFVEAKRAIEEIFKVDPDFYPGYLRLGMIAELSNQLDDALNYYRRAAKLKPYDEDPWRFLVGVYRKLENIKAAEEAAVKVIEITSKKLEASIDDTIVMSRLAEAYARFGGKEEANAILKRVFELEPNDGLALYNCACAYALIGDQSAARFALRRAFESGFRTVASWAKMDSAFDSMREDPQLNHLLAELRV
jgi:adenylate cyclase